MNRKLGDFWTNTGIGGIAVIVYALLTLNTEELFRLLPTLMALVVCTAGLSLLIIIPALYIIGTILYALGLGLSYLFTQVRSKANAQPSASQSLPSVPSSAKIVAVANYIAAARESGLSNLQISANLEANGWDQQSIAKGFDYILFRQQLQPAA